MLKKYIITFLISMVPLIELRVAVPYALAAGLPVLPSYIIAIVGNMLPVPVIFFFARKVLEWGKDKKVIGKFFTFCLEKGHKGGEKLKEKAGKGLYFALFLFVGIPLPGTGAWTGTLAASILDMDFKKSIAAVMSGVVLAGIIMGTGTKIVLWISQMFMAQAGGLCMDAYTDFASVYDEFMEDTPYDEWCENIVDNLRENGITVVDESNEF